MSRLGKEQVLRSSELTRVRGDLDHLKATPGLLAMSIDSYQAQGLILLELDAARFAAEARAELEQDRGRGGSAGR